MIESKIVLGCEAKDKITGFSGLVVAKIEYLFGCTQWGISPKVLIEGKIGDTIYFDEGRIDVIGKGISKEEVKGEKPGGLNSRELPKKNTIISVRR